jgi:hypothetical protein
LFWNAAGKLFNSAKSIQKSGGCQTMQICVRFVRAASILMLFNAPILSGAQTPEASLDSFILQSVAEAQNLDSATISEWTIRHADEKVEEPAERDRGYDSGSARDRRDRELEGRWCLRSTGEINLAGGMRVRRTALFYQPLVELKFANPLPPLPTETGATLRRHECRLVKILYEFGTNADAQSIAEAISKRIPWERSGEPGELIVVKVGNDYWKPLYSFSNHGFYFLFTHSPAASIPKGARADQEPAVLLEWEGQILEHGSPSTNTVNPEAGQPWLAMRAATLAQLPEGPTLAMLSVLAPQVGDQFEQPPFHCREQLVPVLREWMRLAALSTPQQHAAALLLADRVARRLSDCYEFSDSSDYVPPEEETEGDTDVALRKDLKELGIETDKSARPGPEYYAGNLLAPALKLAPTGVVNELYWMAILDDRCQWSQATDVDCTGFIREGESFLTHFPEDEWTPSVHLILAEAYSVTAAELDGSDFATSDDVKTELLKKTVAHYRAWYARSANARDRALVWQEVWGIEAGMGPWLMVPRELR